MEEWQRRMVDPNWGGGKFGSYPGFAGPVGTAMLLSALPGMGYRGALRNLWARNARANRSRIPSFPSPNGGTVFRGTRFGKDATLNDLRGSFTRPVNAVRPQHAIIRDALKPILGPPVRTDHSLRGVRPFRGPRGTLGLYKGTKTGQAKPPEGGGINPLKNMREWWRLNTPWM